MQTVLGWISFVSFYTHPPGKKRAANSIFSKPQSVRGVLATVAFLAQWHIRLEGWDVFADDLCVTILMQAHLAFQPADPLHWHEVKGNFYDLESSMLHQFEVEMFTRNSKIVALILSKPFLSKKHWPN